MTDLRRCTVSLLHILITEQPILTLFQILGTALPRIWQHISHHSAFEGQGRMLLGSCLKTTSQLQCGDTVNLKFQPLQSALVPSVHCTCELWGVQSPKAAKANKTRAESEQLNVKFLKSVCGLGSNTPSAMLLTELGMSCLAVFWWRNTCSCSIGWMPLLQTPCLMLFYYTISMMLFRATAGTSASPALRAWPLLGILRLAAILLLLRWVCHHGAV